MKSYILLILLFLAPFTGFSDTVSVGTLNGYLFFQPQYTGNRIALKGRSTEENYPTKVAHLQSFVTQVDIVGMQETEQGALSDLGEKAQYNIVYVPGKDTYTGENTGILVRPRFQKISNLGRVPELNAIISKHTLAKIQTEHTQFLFLTVHLIRPIGAEAEKHERQLQALTHWAHEQRNIGRHVIIVGDFNDTGLNLLGEEMQEVIHGETHLTHKQFDHIYISPEIIVMEAKIDRPPYAKHPSDMQKTEWTDHYFAQATLNIP